MTSIRRFLSRHRYLLTAAALLALLTGQALRGDWQGDFWEHAAVVRELRARPLNPLHPQLAIDAPHAFFSPYAWLVAIVCRIGTWTALEGLTIFGVLNLILWLAGFYLFVSRMLQTGRGAFYALLFTLLLWGPGAWGFSGFFHLGMLAYGMSYPSTFAAALSFFGFWALRNRLEDGRPGWWFLMTGIAVVVLLSHPITFLFLCAGWGALWLARDTPQPVDGLRMVGVLGGAGLVALAWPLFPFEGLLAGQSDVFHESNRLMYAHLAVRTMPAWPGVAALIWRWKRQRRDPLVLLFGGLLLIYLGGAALQKWTYGRVLSYLVMTLHIAMGDMAARAEAAVPPFAGQGSRRIARSLVMAAVAVSLLVFAPRVMHVFRRALRTGAVGYADYRFLRNQVPGQAVLLSDPRTSFMIPAFAGRVVAVTSALAFVPDHTERQQALERFYRSDTSPEDRRRTIDRYDCRYLLIDRARADPGGAWLETLGIRVIPMGGQGTLSLYRLAADAGEAP